MLDQLLSKLLPGELIPIVAIVMVFGTAIITSVTAVIAGAVRQFREREMRVNFVRELVEHGLPTDEIERLVRATGKKSSGDRTKETLEHSAR